MALWTIDYVYGMTLMNSMKAGDSMIIHTPGGGGYGHPDPASQGSEGTALRTKPAWMPAQVTQPAYMRANGSLAGLKATQEAFD